MAALREGSGRAASRSTTAPDRGFGPLRTFVAAWPDAGTHRRLAALELGRQKNLRLVGPTRWHVTLRFLGEVPDELVGPLGDALVAGVGRVPGPVECTLGPATAWFSQVRVLQLPARGLAALAAAVDQATAPIVPEPTEVGRPSTVISRWPG